MSDECKRLGSVSWSNLIARNSSSTPCQAVLDHNATMKKITGPFYKGTYLLVQPNTQSE